LSRIESVDVIRMAAIVAVIAIHTTPFEPASATAPSGELPYIIINQLARFAVPFFFAISGYFWGRRINTGMPVGAATLRTLRRLLLLYVAWCLFYLLPFSLQPFYDNGVLGPVKVLYHRLEYFANRPFTLLFAGTKDHLWFISALACAVAISGLFLSRGWFRALLCVAAGLYLFGLLTRAYAASPLGIEFGFNTRNGPFFGTLLFVSGYRLSRFTPQRNWLWSGLLLCSAGALLHFAEIGYIWRHYQVPPTAHDYVIGTYFMGIGATLMALSGHPLLSGRHLATLGKYTLGIYAIHYFFVDLLRPLDPALSSPFWEAGYVVAVLLLSAGSVLLLGRFRLTRPLVV
jgi:surface polysaccharide O-acyltransferase-like enzyme